jgi:hypothetical protein
MNKDELFNAYKKQYEDYKKTAWHENMDCDQWNEYVEECDRLFWQAAEVVLKGMSLDDIYKLSKYKNAVLTINLSDEEIEKMKKELKERAYNELMSR